MPRYNKYTKKQIETIFEEIQQDKDSLVLYATFRDTLLEVIKGVVHRKLIINYGKILSYKLVYKKGSTDPCVCIDGNTEYPVDIRDLVRLSIIDTKGVKK